MAHTRMPGVQGINAKAHLRSEDGTLARQAASMPGAAGSGIPEPASDFVAPAWLRQLRRSKVWTVAALRTKQREIPDWPGCYVFTKSSMPLRPGKVLYVGESINLRDRLGTYLADYRKSKPPGHDPTSGPTEQKKKRKLHNGRLFIFHHRRESGGDAIFVRWVLYGGRPEELEDNLRNYPGPDCTNRWQHQEPWDDEHIDPRFVV